MAQANALNAANVNHDLIAGTGTSYTAIAPSATTGIPLISQGAASDPAFGTAVVEGGGTGATSFTAYSVVCGGTTSTGVLQSVASLGSSGQVLTSNGASMLPTWQTNASGDVVGPASATDNAICRFDGTTGKLIKNSNATVADTTGTITVGLGNLALPSTSADLSAGVISINADRFLSSRGTANTFCGSLAGNGSLTTGTAVSNTGIGANVLSSLTSGNNNVFVGDTSGNLVTAGTKNIGIGQQALYQLDTGSHNVVLGYQSGSSYTTSESSNILIGSSISGTASDSHVLRIGSGTGSGDGQLTTAFIHGINGVSVSNQVIVTANSSTSQIGVVSTVPVTNGGTGIATTTAYAPICGGTTATGAFQAASTNQSNSGYVFTSTGSSSLPTWQALSGLGVTSITGTANQVLANGTSATPQIGAVTLTLPQDIATTSSPTFASETLTSATSAFLKILQTSNDAVSGLLQMQKNRAGGDTSSSDDLGFIGFYGFANSAQRNWADITATQVGAVSGNNAATRIRVSTNTGSASVLSSEFSSAGSFLNYAGGIYQQADNAGFFTGAGNDTNIYYDGTNTLWNLQNVGTGNLVAVVSDTRTDGELVLRQSSTGDANIQWELNGGQQYVAGIDNSDSDKWKISIGNAQGTNVAMSLTNAGEVNFPLQPAFLAYLPSTDTNVTGNGTLFTLGSVTALTEVYDVNSDFNTNGTFTAPVTGKYMLYGNALVIGCTIATDINVQLTTTAASYLSTFYRPAGPTNMVYNFCIVAPMTAGDTAIMRISTSGEGADTDDVYGSAERATRFGGYLLG